MIKQNYRAITILFLSGLSLAFAGVEPGSGVIKGSPYAGAWFPSVPAFRSTTAPPAGGFVV